jgi:CBS domain-containing protein
VRRARHPVALPTRMRTSPHIRCVRDVVASAAPGASILAMSTSHAPRLAHVHVSDAMHHGVLSCAPDTSLGDVARVMAEHRVHCVVVHEGGRSDADGWTVVSDRDLMAAAAEDRIDEPVAGSVAGTSVPSIGAGEPLTRAAQVMAEHDVSHLIVLGAANGRPEGVLSSLDVAMVLAAGRP